MMPSQVLSYIQLGHFLMLVMSVSWAFSTFFFQSLCSIAGPQGNFGQLPLSRLWKSKSKVSKSEELTPLHSRKLLSYEHAGAEKSKCIDSQNTSDEKTTSLELHAGSQDIGNESDELGKTTSQMDGTYKDGRKSFLKTDNVGDISNEFLPEEAKNPSDFLIGTDNNSDNKVPAKKSCKDKGKFQEDSKIECGIEDKDTNSVPLLLESPV